MRAAGRQIGIASITIDTLSDGVQVIERLGLDLPLHPTSTRSQFTTQFTIGTDLRLREFRVTSPGPTDPVVQHGTVEGDSLITVSPGTGEPRWRIPAGSSSLIPPLAAPVALALQQKLRVGERLSVPVFDPRTLAPGIIALTVLDDSVFLVPDSADFDSAAGGWLPAHSDTIPAWKLAWSDGSRSLEMWVDSRGLPIRIVSPAGLEFDRSAFEIVTINYRRSREAGRIQPEPAIVPRTAVAGGAEPDRGIGSLRVRLSVGGQAWRLPADSLAGGSQHMEGDVAVTSQVALAGTDTVPLPEDQRIRWLGDAPFLGIGDSAIQRQAAQIAGPERDPGAVATRLTAWVARNIARVPSLRVPRAATVLRERQADVDGHTVLLVALARASGIPARPVSGILLAGGRFYLHSWVEVYLDRWVPVDPTWGEMPAGANRLRLVTGGLARPLDLLPLVAGLDAELLTQRQRP